MGDHFGARRKSIIIFYLILIFSEFSQNPNLFFPKSTTKPEFSLWLVTVSHDTVGALQDEEAD